MAADVTRQQEGPCGVDAFCALTVVVAACVCPCDRITQIYTHTCVRACALVHPERAAGCISPSSC